MERKHSQPANRENKGSNGNLCRWTPVCRTERERDEKQQPRNQIKNNNTKKCVHNQQMEFTREKG